MLEVTCSGIASLQGGKGLKVWHNTHGLGLGCPVVLCLNTKDLHIFHNKHRHYITGNGKIYWAYKKS